jgi:metal-responsive CopG/Arc/MetJ family transcriptional regulator
VTDTRGPGRPSTGTPIHIRLPPEVLAHVDAWADAEGVSRAEAIRRLLTPPDSDSG